MLTVIMMIGCEHDRNKAAELYKKYYGTMLGTAKKVLPDTALAEDAVSEAFIKIIKNLHKLNDVSCYQTRGFIVVVVRNVALNMLGKHYNGYEVLIDEAEEFAGEEISILEKLTTQEACNNIINCIKSLPQSLSDVLYLSIVLGYTYDEISELLEISRDAAKMRLSRSKRAVRILLQKEVEKNAK